MSIFEAYKQEFSSLQKEIRKNIDEFRDCDVESGFTTKDRQVEALLAQANDLLKQMEVEVRSQDASKRKELSETVMGYKTSIATMKGEHVTVKQKLEREELVGSGSVGNKSNYNKEQRQRLLDTNDKINRQNEKILSAQRTVAETEEVGAEIIDELGRNREKIQSSHNKIKDFVGLTDSARRILASMSRRENHQKLTIVFICVALLIIIVLSWYYS